MSLAENSRKFFKLLLLSSLVSSFFSCGSEANPYVKDAANALPQSESTSPGSTDSGHSNPTGGSSSGNSTPVNVPTATLNDLYNAACKAIKGIKLEANMTEELAVYCNGEVATGKFAEIIGLAYDGNGEPKTQKTLKLVSKGSETEFMIPSVMKVPKSVKDILAVGAKKYNYTVTGDGTTITDTMMQELPVSGDHMVAGFLVKETIQTKVMFVTMEDISIQKSISLDLGDPKLAFTYDFLASGQSDNSDNRLNSRVSFNFQVQDSLTYIFSVSHITVNNKGIASVAEQKVVGQPPLITKKIFSLLTGK